MALSPQLPHFLAAWVEEDEIPYPVLSDLGNGVAGTYRIRFTLPDDLRAVYREPLGLDLERYNGDASWTLPLPATFVIRPDGTLAYAGVNADYTHRPEPDEVVEALRDL